MREVASLLINSARLEPAAEPLSGGPVPAALGRAFWILVWGIRFVEKPIEQISEQKNMSAMQWPSSLIAWSRTIFMSWVTYPCE